MDVVLEIPALNRAETARGGNHHDRRAVQANVKHGKVIRVAAASAALLLPLAGCGGAGTAERPLQRVQIVAREGPTIGAACRAGRRCERPYRGGFDLITGDGHRTAVTTDSRGRAAIDIPAGTYRITTARTHPPLRLTSAIVAGRSVRVLDDRFVLHVRAVNTQTVALFFDTGIR